MKKPHHLAVVLAALALSIALAQGFAAPRPAAVYGDNAVLQRDVPLPVWGWANPGETVRVSYGPLSASATAGPDGIWRAQLPPLSPGPAQDLIFESEGNGKAVSKNVLVGDVWLCSGQSNMAFSVGEAIKKQPDLDEIAAQATVPEIRQLRGSVHVTYPDKPRIETDAQWTPASPEAAKGFSEVSYLFARRLYDLYHVPQGIVVNAVAGTYIESWMSAEALQSAGIYDDAQKRWQQQSADYAQSKTAYAQALQTWTAAKQKADAAGQPFTDKAPASPKSPIGPSGCFNAMTAPLVGFPLKGMIWYQGEQNIGLGLRYTPLLQALWGDLRTKWNQGPFPILYVQLPNLEANGADRTEWAVLRQAQADAQQEPNVFMAVAIDLGTPKDIHPPDKREVAHRLTLLAEKEIYHEDGLVARGPQLTGVAPADGGLQLTFDAPVTLQPPKTEGKSFEVAGDDRKFVLAQATPVEGKPQALSVRSDALPHPRYVRYLWANAPAAVVYGEARLPAAPFEAEVGMPGK